MAKATPAPEAQSTPDLVEMMADASHSWDWETVVDSSPTVVLFEEIGEEFVGQFVGDEHITPDNGGEEFERFVFIGLDGERYAINKSYKLEEGMKKVSEGQWCRITYTKEIPTGRKQNPMKDFRVDVRKA